MKWADCYTFIEFTRGRIGDTFVRVGAVDNISAVAIVARRLVRTVSIGSCSIIVTFSF